MERNEPKLSRPDAAGPGDRPFDWPVDLYCPACAGPLGRSDEAAPYACPACGAALDLDRLRRLRREGLFLGMRRELLRNILFRPGRYLRGLPAPRYYVLVSGGDVRLYQYFFMGWSLGLALVIGELFPILVAASYTPVAYLVVAMPFLWGLVLLAAHGAAGLWVRLLLHLAGHRETVAGVRRVMLFASPAYLLMSLVFCLFIWTAANPTLAWWHNRARGAEVPLGSVLLAAVYVALWLHWSWVVMRAVQAESRGLSARLGFWAFLNPGLLIALAPIAFLTVRALTVPQFK